MMFDDISDYFSTNMLSALEPLDPRNCLCNALSFDAMRSGSRSVCKAYQPSLSRRRSVRSRSPAGSYGRTGRGCEAKKGDVSLDVLVTLKERNHVSMISFVFCRGAKVRNHVIV